LLPSIAHRIESFQPQGNQSPTAFSTAPDYFFAKFGKPRIAGSHHVYKTPWPGDPRINIQKDGPKAKRYQIIQMVEAVDKLKALRAAQAAEAPEAAAATKKTSRQKGR
jgi:hypothetical protein